MADNFDFPMFSLNNDKGETLDISTWKGKFQIKVWLAKNDRAQGSNIMCSVVSTVLHEMAMDAARLVKENVGFTISKMLTRYDETSKSRKPYFLWTFKKVVTATSVYELIVDFPEKGRSFSFPFSRHPSIVCTSEEESVETTSLNQLKLFVETFKPQSVVLIKGLSKPPMENKPASEIKKDYMTSTPSVNFGNPGGKSDEDIPF